jgi:hypothetical protein
LDRALMGIILVVPMLAAALIAGGLARWTRLPLLVAPLVLGGLVAAAALVLVGASGSTAGPGAALIAGIIIACAASLGTFLGRLRRDHVERTG